MATPTYLRDGYLFFKESKTDSFMEDRLIIDSEKIEESCNYIIANNIKSITINPSYSSIQTLEFLNKIPFVERVFILQDNLDLSYLYCLKSLKRLTFNEARVKLDFNNFPNLEELGISCNKNTINIGNCKKIFRLWLDNYKMNDLNEFSDLNNLKYLSLHKTSIKSLTGIEKLLKLEDFLINSANKLESLNGISKANINLKNLDIYGAKNLVNYDSITQAKSLELLWLKKTGNIESISFLKELTNLKSVVIGMKVLDGNMIYMKGFSEAAFIDFPHYNLKNKELKKDLKLTV